MSTLDLIRNRIAEYLGQPAGEIDTGAKVAQLVADSFAFVEMVLTLEEEFSIQLSRDDLSKIETVADLLAVVEARVPVPA